MSSPETAGANTSSLARDWLYALRYWLRGRRAVAVLVATAVVVGGALNWSWLVAVGIAPLLLAVLPCAVMCGLGLCMNKMAGSSCSTSSGAPDHSGTPMPNAVQRIAAASRPVSGMRSQSHPNPALCQTTRPLAPWNRRPTENPKSRKRGSDMRTHLKALLVASTLAAGLAAAPVLYAHDSDGAGGSMMSRGMMGEGGMMGMMGQMSSMMESCSQMMQAMMEDGHEPVRPNEQWRDQSPRQPDQPDQSR